MAFDEALADRVCDALAPRADVSEQGVRRYRFMLGGNMAVGVIGDDLMVRLDLRQLLGGESSMPGDLFGIWPKKAPVPIMLLRRSPASSMGRPRFGSFGPLG